MMRVEGSTQLQHINVYAMVFESCRLKKMVLAIGTDPEYTLRFNRCEFVEGGILATIRKVEFVACRIAQDGSLLPSPLTFPATFTTADGTTSCL